jgi:cytochrome c-type biogenesis protein CcmH/NrfG
MSTQWLLGLVVAVTVAFVFLPALRNGFVDWDDDVNIYENPNFRGLGWKQLRWMLTTTLMGHYIPVTWLTFGLDFTLWGMNPFGYHLTNVLLHAANVFLLYFIAQRLIRPSRHFDERAVTIGAVVATLLFGMHPLRVESVAWVTERRDVLSGFFFLLTILAYLDASCAEGRRRRWLLAGSFASYVLAMGSKSIVMVLPVILFLLDVYPLRRFHADPGRWLRVPMRRVWLEKLPFIALAVAGGIVSYRAVASLSFVSSFEKYPWPARIAMGAYNLAFYLWKTPLPVALSPLYAIPRHLDPLAPRFVLSVLGVLAISVALVAVRRRWQAGLTAWMCYVVLLVPVSGVAVHGGPQLVTDRYSYLPSLAVGLLAGAGAASLAMAARRGTVRRSFALAAAAGALLGFAGFGVLTWRQTEVWHDTETLWRHALDLDPACDICHGKIGAALTNANQHAVALVHIERALALRPDRIKPHRNIAHILVKERRYAEALPHLELVLARDPADVKALILKGVALMNLEQADAALLQLRLALELEPAHTVARTDLGLALVKLHRTPEAIEEYHRAITFDPKAAPPHVGLARAYLTLGRMDLAREEYRIVQRFDPRLASQLRGSLGE